MTFIDVQVNGYAGIDFNGDPVTPQDMNRVADALEGQNTSIIFPTLITDDPARMTERLANMRAIIDADDRLSAMMPAFHIEGPCLSPEEGYKGAHPEQHMRPASPEIFKPMIEAAGGAKRIAIVTVAPEVDQGAKTTRWLADQGITVSAGHTNASLDELKAGVDNGLTMFTHLSNGCRAEIPRHDNIINRVLGLEAITCSFIPDGYHIPLWLLNQWIGWIGIDRCVFTSDCMSAAANGPGTYKIGPWTLEVGEDKLVHPPGARHLAGSAITMQDAWDNAVGGIGLTDAQAKAVTIDNPRKLIPAGS